VQNFVANKKFRLHLQLITKSKLFQSYIVLLHKIPQKNLVVIYNG